MNIIIYFLYTTNAGDEMSVLIREVYSLFFENPREYNVKQKTIGDVRKSCVNDLNFKSVCQ